MARGYLFLIVVLLAGAAVAGLLAVTRTAQSSPGASATNPAISYRMKKLDRLEASLEKQLSQHSKAAAKSTAAPVVVYRRAPSPVVSTYHGDDEHELAFDDEGDRDD